MLVIATLNLFGAGLVIVYWDPSKRLVDVAMGFAAGGMLYIISGEIIPETHVLDLERAATAGPMVSNLLMLTLDVALGSGTPSRP